MDKQIRDIIRGVADLADQQADRVKGWSEGPDAKLGPMTEKFLRSFANSLREQTGLKAKPKRKGSPRTKR